VTFNPSDLKFSQIADETHSFAKSRDACDYNGEVTNINVMRTGHKQQEGKMRVNWESALEGGASEKRIGHQ